jgi:hypothetical protein
MLSWFSILKAEFCVWSGIFLYLVISRMELIRKDTEKFRSACKILPSGKPALVMKLPAQDVVKQLLMRKSIFG